MRASSFLLAASAVAFASAQDLATALSNQPSLTSLVKLLGTVKNTTDAIAAQKNVTLFAPNNHALATLLQQGGIFSIGQAGADPGLIQQILDYHLVHGVLKASEISEVPQFLPTYLDYYGIVLDGSESGSNVTGGQVVEISLVDGRAAVTSGLKSVSYVTVADIEYDNGIIHIIDRLLTIPLEETITLITGNFTALAGAPTQANLIPTIAAAKDITIFCPSNEAFQRIANGGAGITDKELTEILEYHVIQGTVAYSTTLTNTSIETLAGEKVNIQVDDNGAVYVNSARVINANILVENGVIHVIDEVLNPSKPNAQPNASSAPPLGTAVPFTSGIQPETSVYTQLTATTSFVAAGLVTAMPTTSGMASSGSPTGSSGVAVATGGALRKELPALAAAVMGALAFAIDL